ncbi:MAG: hypothetical protein AAFN81_23575 [Bacteroidota bacterium]
MALIFIGSPDVDPRFFEQTTTAEKTCDYESYDAFLGLGRKSEAEKQARRDKRRAFWSRVGNNVTQSGGAEGIGRTIDNLAGLFSKKQETTEDYSIEVTGDAPPADEKTSTQTWIVGGLILAGVLGLGYLYVKNKNKATS